MYRATLGWTALSSMGMASLLPGVEEAHTWIDLLRQLGPFGLMCIFCAYLIRQSSIQQRDIAAARKEEREASRIHHDTRDKDMQKTRELTERALTSIDNHTASSREMTALLTEVRDANRATEKAVTLFAAQSQTQTGYCREIVAQALREMGKGGG